MSVRHSHTVDWFDAVSKDGRQFRIEKRQEFIGYVSSATGGDLTWIEGRAEYVTSDGFDVNFEGDNQYTVVGLWNSITVYRIT